MWNAAGQVEHTIGSGYLTPGQDYRNWNTFGVLWTEQTMLFYINGVLNYNMSYPPSTWTHDYLNIWLTCIAYQNAPNNADLPSQVLTGDVRYYHKDYVRFFSYFIYLFRSFCFPFGIRDPWTNDEMKFKST
jgi:hypothetical protein